MGTNNIASLFGNVQFEFLSLVKQLKDKDKFQDSNILSSIFRLEESLQLILHNFVVNKFEVVDYHIPKACPYCHKEVVFDFRKITIPAIINGSEVSYSNILVFHCPECKQFELPNITVTPQSDNIPQCTCGWYNIPPSALEKEIRPKDSSVKVKVEVMGHKCPKCGEEYYSNESLRYIEQLEGRGG